MKILFDTNVILDVLLLRKPFYKAATLLMKEVEINQMRGYLCSTTVTTIYYLISKVKDNIKARQLLKNLLHIFSISPVDKLILETALDSEFTDYEDAVLYESAIRLNLNGIVTRNTRDFVNSQITIYDPEELLKIIYTFK